MVARPDSACLKSAGGHKLTNSHESHVQFRMRSTVLRKKVRRIRASPQDMAVYVFSDVFTETGVKRQPDVAPDTAGNLEIRRLYFPCH